MLCVCVFFFFYDVDDDDDDDACIRAHIQHIRFTPFSAFNSSTPVFFLLSPTHLGSFFFPHMDSWEKKKTH